jgi:uncharacterized membrane protein YeaQ/YmgE (transglycosylase-associated protein family)
MTVMHVLGWILFGLIIGLIGRLLVPGRDPMGWIATIVLGIVGSLIGGFISYALGFGGDVYAPGGWIMSIIGAVIALVIYHWATGSARRV